MGIGDPVRLHFCFAGFYESARYPMGIGDPHPQECLGVKQEVDEIPNGKWRLGAADINDDSVGVVVG